MEEIGFQREGLRDMKRGGHKKIKKGQGDKRRVCEKKHNETTRKQKKKKRKKDKK